MNMKIAKISTICGVIVTIAIGVAAPASAGPVNLVINGSFEGATGVTPAGWTVGGSAFDHYPPVAIAYNQTGLYPFGAQGESVPTDNANSLSPNAAGSNGVYFVSDEAKNLSLYQYVYLTPGSYDIGFDSYDTYNGSVQPNDATLTAEIAGVQLANFSASSVSPGSWSSHAGEAQIQTAGEYLVSFVFNTPDTPANPDPSNPNGEYNAKDIVIDRAYVFSASNGGGTPIPSAVPEPASVALLGAGLAGVAALRRWRKAVRGGND